MRLPCARGAQAGLDRRGQGRAWGGRPQDLIRSGPRPGGAAGRAARVARRPDSWHDTGVTPVHDPAAFLQRWHYWGLFAVILAEESGVPLPLPGDLFIAAMGFLASAGPERSRWSSFVTCALVVTGATVLGASILFLLSRRFGHRLLAWAGRWLGYDAAKQSRLEAWLQRNGFLAVAVGRLI